MMFVLAESLHLSLGANGICYINGMKLKSIIGLPNGHQQQLCYIADGFQD